MVFTYTRTSSFNTRRLHPLKAQPIRLPHLQNLHPIPPRNPLQLPRIQLTITPPRLNHPRLLLQREVLPREPRPHNIPEERQHLVVRNRPRVRKVEDARLLVFGERD